MSNRLCFHIGFHNHHNIEQIGKLLMPDVHLIDLCLNILFNRRFFQIRFRHMLIIELFAIFFSAYRGLNMGHHRGNRVRHHSAVWKSDVNRVV
jgi:hypothetical protein